MGTVYTILQIAFVATGIILIVLIMLRKGDMDSLSGAFGGMGGNTAFGVKGQKQLDKIIIYLSVIFLVVSLALNTPKFRKGTQAPTGGDTNQTTPETPKK